MNCKRYFTGALAAFMVASSAFMTYADGPVAVGTDPAGLTSAPGENTGTGNAAPTAQETVQAAPEAQSNSSQTVSAGNNGAGSGTQTVTAGNSNTGSGAQTVTAGNSSTGAGTQTVTAGSSNNSGAQTVTAGSQAAASAPATSGTQTSGPAVVTSGVITAGSSQAGPGSGSGSSISVPAVVEAGNLSFAGQLSSPIVKVVDKYSYDQMTKDINSLKSRYGSHMQVNSIGTSLDGRTLYEMIIGNPNASKHVLIHAGIHAREYMTPLLVMKQAEHLLAFYDSGAYQGRKLSDILSGVAVHIVPMVNPDGITISQFGVSALRSSGLRQTVNQCYAQDTADGRTSQAFDRYLSLWKANGRGVDLNQNFPALWDSISTGPSHASYANYKGTSALSEPESQALANLVNSRSWSLTISYHSMGNLVYWDFAGNKVSAESKALADLVTGISGYRTNTSSGKGGFKDYVQIKDNPVPSLTIEVGSVACPMPVSEFGNVWNSNQSIMAAVAAYAADH